MKLQKMWCFVSLVKNKPQKDSSKCGKAQELPIFDLSVRGIFVVVFLENFLLLES